MNSFGTEKPHFLGILGVQLWCADCSLGLKTYGESKHSTL